MAHQLCRRFCRPQAGQRFSLAGEDYELAGKIGDGAAGVVRKAIRRRDRAVKAVKFLAPDPKYIEESSFDDVAMRFRREGERGSKLECAFLIKIHNYAANDDGDCFSSRQPKNPFLLMDFIRGNTLESFIRNLPKDESDYFTCTPEKLDIALQLTEAISYLHGKKLVHRDIKPANVFFARNNGDGRPVVKLGDFGIVKWGDFHAALSTGVLTATHQRGLGTLKYMPPEQAIAPKNVGAKSDIFSLGITLFELFAGKILLSPHHVFEVMNARLSRGTTISRFRSMSYSLHIADQDIGELLLDMHLRGVQGRPSIDRVRGILGRAFERVTGREWETP